jgi:hypothetical protein
MSFFTGLFLIDGDFQDHYVDSIRHPKEMRLHGEYVGSTASPIAGSTHCRRSFTPCVVEYLAGNTSFAAP